MAYQAKRHKRFQEDFELADEQGNIVKTLHVWRVDQKYQSCYGGSYRKTFRTVMAWVVESKSD